MSVSVSVSVSELHLCICQRLSMSVSGPMFVYMAARMAMSVAMLEQE